MKNMTTKARRNDGQISLLVLESIFKDLGLTPVQTIDLTGSKISMVRIAGNEVQVCYWQQLYRLLHCIGYEHFGSLEELERHVPWEIAPGRRDSDGFEYGYIEKYHFSVRGVDANTAWERSKYLAELSKLPLIVKAIGADKRPINLE